MIWSRAGLAATAGPLVATMLGEKWAEVAPVVQLLAFAMPFMTLQALLTPACDARGKPGVGVRNGAIGAALLAGAFLVGVRWGPTGLALGWVVAYPTYLFISLGRSLPVIGVSARAVAGSVLPALLAAIAMGATVVLADSVLPAMPAGARLAALVGIGAPAYALWLLAFARPLLRELVATARGQAD